MTRRTLAFLAFVFVSGCGASQPAPQNESLADTPPHADEPAATPATAVEPPLAGRGDADGDRIIDLCDECINEPEIFNGEHDQDGCPDRGAILLIDERIRLIERIFFARNSHELAGRDDVMQAIAATLQGNPQIIMVGIVGHAARNERDVHALARRRAEAVQQRLIALGIDTTRLAVYESGSADPYLRETPNAEENRAVSFAIMQTDERVFATWDGTRMNELPQPELVNTPLVFHRVPLSAEASAECQRMFAPHQ